MRTANLFKIAVFLLLSFASSEQVHTTFWKSMVPNATMPRGLSMDTRPAGNDIAWLKLGQQKAINYFEVNYGKRAADNRPTNSPATATLFFLEKELYNGNTFMMEISRSENSSSVFLPHNISDSMPLSLPLMLNRYSFKEDSEEASQVKNTINTCTLRAIKGEERKCVTSLESMIDFAISSLGKGIEAYSTEAEKNTQLQDFKVLEGMKIVGDEAVTVCHKLAYPYAVYLCHTLKPTKAYLVPLIGTSHVTNANAIAVCHMNTTEFNPGHMAFRVLGVKPGTVPICHFLSEFDVVWTRI